MVMWTLQNCLGKVNMRVYAPCCDDCKFSFYSHHLDAKVLVTKPINFAFETACSPPFVLKSVEFSSQPGRLQTRPLQKGVGIRWKKTDCGLYFAMECPFLFWACFKALAFPQVQTKTKSPNQSIEARVWRTSTMAPQTAKMATFKSRGFHLTSNQYSLQNTWWRRRHRIWTEISAREKAKWRPIPVTKWTWRLTEHYILHLLLLNTLAGRIW